MSLSQTPTTSSKGPGQQAVRPTNFTYGRSVSGANPSTNLVSSVDNAFKITVNGSGPYDVSLDISTYPELDTGTKIAVALQRAIQGVIPSDPLYNQAFREFIVEFREGKYFLYSGLPGEDSEVVITNGIAANLADDLKLGLANGGTEDAVYPKESSYIPYVEVLNDDTRPVPVNVVDGNITIDTGDINVDLSHDGPNPDSVRIGDGTDLLGINPDGSIDVITEAAVVTPTIENFNAILANTEYSYTFPANTKRFYLKDRALNARIQFSYDMGDSGTNYITVQRGCGYLEKSVIMGAGITIYFQVDKPSTIVEILSWA